MFDPVNFWSVCFLFGFFFLTLLPFFSWIANDILYLIPRHSIRFMLKYAFVGSLYLTLCLTLFAIQAYLVLVIIHGSWCGNQLAKYWLARQNFNLFDNEDF